MLRPVRWRAVVGVAAALLTLRCAGEPPTDRSPAASAAPPAAASPSPAPDDSAFVAAVDAIAADALQRGPIAGLSIAVFEHGRRVVAKGYGSADVDAGVPASPATSYPIASVSKHFTA